MGETTNIGWCHHTFNIVWGCNEVSPGCDNCYARVMAKRLGFDVWGSPHASERRVFGAKYWAAPLAWNLAAEAAGERRRVFCSSMGDVFEAHPTVDTEREKLWPLIRATPWLDWLVLTKRPERLANHLPDDWGDGYPNVWLGTSVENQRWARRVLRLLWVPAAVHFVSAEPLLGPLTLANIDAPRDGEKPREFNELDLVDALEGSAFYFDGMSGHLERATRHKIGWVIVGGESGPDDVRRDMQIAWMERIVEECTRNGVPVYVKQDSARKDSMQGRIRDELWARKEFPRQPIIPPLSQTNDVIHSA